MNTILNTTAKAAIIFSIITQLSACSSGELGFTAGAVVGAVVADSVTSDSNNHHRRGDYGHYRGYNSHLTLLNSDKVITNENIDKVEESLSERFEISKESAALLVDTSEKLNQGDYSDLKTLDLTEETLLKMSRGENPSAETLRQVMNLLKVDESGAHNIIQALVAKADTIL